MKIAICEEHLFEPLTLNLRMIFKYAYFLQHLMHNNFTVELGVYNFEVDPF